MWLKNIFKTANRTRRRKLAQPQSAARVDHLEARTLLTVFWENAGNDNFDAAYGAANAQLARDIVNHAIDDWNATIHSTVDLDITFEAAALTGLGETEIALSDIDANGVPTAATIRLDDLGGNAGWYFDPTIEDDSEFLDLDTSFSAQSNVVTGNDFYFTVSHEIAHALGYLFSDALAIDNFLIPTGVPAHWYTFNGPNITETLTIQGGLHSLDQLDIMAEAGSPGTRRLISDSVAQILSDAYGYGVTLPSDRDTLHVSTDNGDVIVTAIDGQNSADNIWVDRLFGSTRVWFDGDLETVSATGSVSVDAGDGNDTITISDYHLDIDDFSVVGGSGTDTGKYLTGNDANMSTFVGYYGSNNGKTIYRQPNGTVGPVNPADLDLMDTDRLWIVGGSADDTIDIRSNTYTSVEVWGNDGNDFINAWNNGAATSAELHAFGGAGNDIIWGTPNHDIISGGSGNDSLWGGWGRDIIIGGTGFDGLGGITANQFADGDIVIGGSTAHDENRSVLMAVASLWKTSSSQTVISSTYFITSGSGITVFDDGISDTISIYAQTDWNILS